MRTDADARLSRKLVFGSDNVRLSEMILRGEGEGGGAAVLRSVDVWIVLMKTSISTLLCNQLTSSCFRIDADVPTLGFPPLLTQGDNEKPFKYHKTVLADKRMF